MKIFCSLVVLNLCLFLNCRQYVSCAHSMSFDILSKLYIPYAYNPDAEFAIDKDAAEQMSYDANTKLVYAVGGDIIHVVNMTDVLAPHIIHHISLSDTDITDVEVCDQYVFVACDNKLTGEREKGYVNIYRTWNSTTGTMELLHHVEVGTIPDMVHPLSSCKKALVAIEAEPYDNGGAQAVDRPGAIGIITLADDADTDAPHLKILGFEQFNSRFDELAETGVRFVLQDNNTFANDVEPEYIAFNTDETRAYVVLQENNAIAVVDLDAEVIENIYGLGYKNWSNFLLDPSDQDGGIHMASWPVYGMYQPDAIKTLRFNGVDYLITANEGDAKDPDEARVEDLTLDDVFATNNRTLADLQATDKLGRLKVTKGGGKNATSGKYEALYAYGARGFSIWRASNMEQVYDSEDEISRKTALLLPDLFNANADAGSLVSEEMDSRSDDKGSETESLTLAHFGSTTLIFVGNERPGFIAVYSIDNTKPLLSPKFEQFIHDIPRFNATYYDLYEAREVSMLDPEDMHFVPASDSPNGQPLLIVSGSVSGTITVIQINMDKADEGDPNNPTSAANTVLLQHGVYFACLSLIFAFTPRFPY